MIGYDIACKHGLSYDDSSLNIAYDCVQLKENHEAGEIINGYWLILNDNFFEGDTGKYNKGDYVKIINIKYFEVFATDINYDNRKDLEKIRTESYPIKDNEFVNVNIYVYMH